MASKISLIASNVRLSATRRDELGADPLDGLVDQVLVVGISWCAADVK